MSDRMILAKIGYEMAQTLCAFDPCNSWERSDADFKERWATLADAVVAAEREACVAVLAAKLEHYDGAYEQLLRDCIAAIRARGTNG